MNITPNNARLVARTEIASGLVILRIAPDQPLRTFKPGQEPAIGAAEVGKLHRRAYSIASAPETTDHVEFLIVNVDRGRLSPFIAAAPVGQRLWMEEVARGKFTLDTIVPGRDLIFVATGAGLAPFMSMIRSNAAHPPWRRLLLLHGVRQVAHLAHRAELESLSPVPPRFGMSRSSRENRRARYRMRCRGASTSC